MEACECRIVCLFALLEGVRGRRLWGGSNREYTGLKIEKMNGQIVFLFSAGYIVLEQNSPGNLFSIWQFT